MFLENRLIYLNTFFLYFYNLGFFGGIGGRVFGGIGGKDWSLKFIKEEGRLFLVFELKF